MIRRFTLAVTTVLATAVLQAAPDWPQWQGPDRTRISKETGLLKEWPRTRCSSTTSSLPRAELPDCEAHTPPGAERRAGELMLGALVRC